jgi:hypothetical protein
MGNLPNTKAPDHSATKAPLNVHKHDHPPKTRPTNTGAPTSGGPK